MWFVALLKQPETFTPPPFVPVVRTPTSAIVVNIEKCTATFTPINNKITQRRPEPERRRPPKLIWCRPPLRTCVMSVHWRCRQVTIRCQRVPFVICPSIIPAHHACRFQTSLHMAMQAMIFMLRDSLIVVSSLMMPVQLVDDYPTWFSYGFLGALRAYSVTSRGHTASGFDLGFGGLGASQ